LVSNSGGATNTIETQVPARIDRLPWSRWHTLVILALGITWVLDGLEITIQGNIADALTNPETGLGLSAGQVGYAAVIYIAGACAGALFFSCLTDRRSGIPPPKSLSHVRLPESSEGGTAESGTRATRQASQKLARAP
jgi:MFS family permease